MAAISLCMIVRNEENNIERCLKSAVEYVDEIIVADTGSTDQTKLICEKYGVKLYDFEWKDDFSAARNFSIGKATGDWILWMDADEELKVYDFQTLSACLQDTEDECIPVRMVHFHGASPAHRDRSYLSSACRLFRNGIGHCFSGRIHEKLSAMHPGQDTQLKYSHFIEILHYGYMDDEMEHKRGRNMELLLREKEAFPDDEWVSYHLAVEYYHEKNYTLAYELVVEAVLLFLNKGILPPALVYKLKYDILTTLKAYEVIVKSVEKAIELYPDYVDLYFYKGLAQFSLEDYEKAQETFQHCISIGESNPDYLILAGAGSFTARDYIKRCQKALKGSDKQKKSAGKKSFLRKKQ